MVFGGQRGEMLVVKGCGMNRLDSAKLVSYVSRTSIKYEQQWCGLFFQSVVRISLPSTHTKPPLPKQHEISLFSYRFTPFPSSCLHFRKSHFRLQAICEIRSASCQLVCFPAFSFCLLVSYYCYIFAAEIC